MTLKKPHPTYDSPQGPVKDFVRYIAEDDSPVCADPFDVQVERARRSLREGEDFLVDMGDGAGPRLASVVLEEVANPVTWAAMLARINRNIDLTAMGEEAEQWPKQP
ncbi:hypothetical protein PARHAE_03951 [Paracoccus haematequi]|uniref:Uncharacterized protein n=2 Tax=Paracoccus haematequi TaxID=2491866 RepID=A0A447ITA5_9RHOB|nr:hypothetical protein PARHAE_03951 [Paracoccus haematequi]